MLTRPPAPPPSRSLAARVGFLASALVVFLCGWFAMQTNDWKRMVGFSALALVAAAVASAFSRRR